MEVVVKTFKELSIEELYEIYYWRTAIFVVEQNCPYQDIDEYDKKAYHVYLKDEQGIQAYLRVIEPGAKFAEASLGRVISRRRRQGLGLRLVLKGIEVAQKKYHARAIRIEAQVYAKGLYEKAGFTQVSDIFLEDDQPHIQMLWKDN
jgi:Predicted acyltransferase